MQPVGQQSLCVDASEHVRLVRRLEPRAQLTDCLQRVPLLGVDSLLPDLEDDGLGLGGRGEGSAVPLVANLLQCVAAPVQARTWSVSEAC